MVLLILFKIHVGTNYTCTFKKKFLATVTYKLSADEKQKYFWKKYGQLDRLQT